MHKVNHSIKIQPTSSIKIQTTYKQIRSNDQNPRGKKKKRNGSIRGPDIGVYTDFKIHETKMICSRNYLMK